MVITKELKFIQVPIHDVEQDMYFLPIDINSQGFYGDPLPNFSWWGFQRIHLKCDGRAS